MAAWAELASSFFFFLSFFFACTSLISHASLASLSLSLSRTGWMAKRLILSGGTSLLAETDELIGAEAYVTEKIPNLETGRK